MATVNPVSTYSHAEAMVPDDIPDDEGYAQSTEVSYVTSLASSICRGVEENGRTYASYAKNVQGVPIDSEEQDRNDLQHAKFFLLLGDRLHLSPVPESVSRILDIGTGTGIWAMDMADRFPAAQVIGTDVAAVQPNWVPPNCQFEIEDAEDDWLFEKNYFDFIHARELLLTIHDWPRLIAQSYECLQPGGYLELGMTYPRTCCDDGSLDLKTSYFRETADLFYEMAEKMGAPIDDCRLWKDQMMEAGFVDVQEVVYPIPTGPWYVKSWLFIPSSSKYPSPPLPILTFFSGSQGHCSPSPNESNQTNKNAIE